MHHLALQANATLARFAAFAAAVALAGACPAAHALAQDVGSNVLVLHSNQRATPAGILIEDALRATVATQVKHPVEVYSEYLDSEVPSSAGLASEQMRFLAHKYGARNIGVLVASGPGSMPFGLQLREIMGSDAPLVHVAIPVDALRKASYPAFVVGRPLDPDPSPTLKLALRLHPDTGRIVVVLGAAERDRGWERRVRAAADALPEGPSFEYWSALPTREILRRVAALPRRTLVFTPGYFNDGGGETVTPRHSVERIATASAVPVYGPLDTFLDTGAVGGSVTPFDGQARAAGAIVARLLNGAVPSEIDTSPLAQVAMVDWRQLRRWGIDEELLPAGTIVRYREPGMWQRYQLEIAVLVGVLVLQAGLITALLLERRSRRRTASALEERDAQMKLAASAARLTSWVWDTAGEDAKSRDAISFDRVAASVHPADRGSFTRSVNQAIATGRELDVEYRVLDPQGQVRWMSARGRAEARGSRRLRGVALDITERKVTELRAAEDRNALRHMSRVSMVGQLSAAIAHQLYQPLSAIMGNAETAQKMLRRDDIDVAELQEICKDIVSENRRAADVIRRLSDLYKRDRKETQRIDLDALVRDTLDLLRTELVVRHVIARTEFGGEPCVVDGDPVQLQQVILNLVINAADAVADIEGEREVVIRTLSEGDNVRMCVIDNGRGIAQEQVDEVFNPFWTTKPGGMGMGLAICRSIAAAHHGTITAANNPGRGATFCLSLPAAKPA